jgi:hypothetical protein
MLHRYSLKALNQIAFIVDILIILMPFPAGEAHARSIRDQFLSSMSKHFCLYLRDIFCYMMTHFAQ